MYQLHQPGCFYPAQHVICAVFVMQLITVYPVIEAYNDLEAGILPVFFNGCIYHYSPYPSFKRTFFPKVFNVLKHLHKTLVECIFCFFPARWIFETNGKHFCSKQVIELVLGASVPFNTPPQKVIFAFCPQRCLLCILLTENGFRKYRWLIVQKGCVWEW